MKLVQETDNVSILSAIENLFQKEGKNWWTELSEKQKEMLIISLKQAAQGEMHDFKEFISPYL